MISWPTIALLTLSLFQSEKVSNSSQGEPSKEQKIATLTQRADSGDPKAQVDLGVIYASGDGVPTDELEAVKWFRKAADQGNAAGEYSLAEMYLTGRGVSVEYAEALKWMQRAAGQGELTRSIISQQCTHRV